MFKTVITITIQYYSVIIPIQQYWMIIEDPWSLMKIELKSFNVEKVGSQEISKSNKFAKLIKARSKWKAFQKNIKKKNPKKGKISQNKSNKQSRSRTPKEKKNRKDVDIIKVQNNLKWAIG